MFASWRQQATQPNSALLFSSIFSLKVIVTLSSSTIVSYSSVSYSLLVNGKPSGLIRPTCGIRQGDPLSPYIFIICMELLSTQLLSKAAQPKSGLSISLSPTNMKISCLFFTDDCLLFSKASVTACNRLKLLLETCCGLPGQMINYQKSTMPFSKNAYHAHKQIVSSIFNITRSESLGKYLGCPVFQGKPKASTLSLELDLN